MKKRLLGILLSLALMLTMIPVLGLSQTAYADPPDPPNVSIDPQGSGDVEAVYDSGNFILTATAAEGKAFDHWSYLDDGGHPTTGTDNPWIEDWHTIANISGITAHFVDAYPLWVGGVQVNSANKGDVLGDGKVSYTPAEDETPAKLTLNGANITEGYDPLDDGAVYGIYYEGGEHEPLIIESPSGSDNKIIRLDVKFDTGIRSRDVAAITLSGNGKLTTEGSSAGIYASEITIAGTDVTATSDINVAISAYDVVVESGIVTASGKGDDSKGIFVDNEVTIKGGKVTASGGECAIVGNVKNYIKGTGWTDTAGTQGKADIAINSQGQKLKTYKKVQFPAVPEPVKESTITYDLNGGTWDGKTGIVTQTVNNGTVITLPAPTRDGYTFDYWEGSKYNAGDKYTVNGDHTFKAVWKTADKGGGSDSDNKGGSSKKGVKTGDEQNVAGWITMMIASVLALAALAVKRKDILHR